MSSFFDETIRDALLDIVSEVEDSYAVLAVEPCEDEHICGRNLTQLETSLILKCILHCCEEMEDGKNKDCEF